MLSSLKTAVMNNYHMLSSLKTAVQSKDGVLFFSFPEVQSSQGMQPIYPCGQCMNIQTEMELHLFGLHCPASTSNDMQPWPQHHSSLCYCCSFVSKRLLSCTHTSIEDTTGWFCSCSCWLYVAKAAMNCTLLTGFVVVEVFLYVHRNRRLIRDGSPGRPPRLSRSSCEQPLRRNCNS